MSALNDNYAIHKVSLKRTRQACGPCRRKKARCPGEKPTCALCQRLGQRCTYGSQPTPNRARHTRAPSKDGQEQNPSEWQETNPTNIEGSQAFQRIEKQLDNLTDILQQNLSRATPFIGAPVQNSQSSHVSPRGNNSNFPDAPFTNYGPIFGFPSSGKSVLPWPLFSNDFMKSEVDTYLRYFHDQPYCVFSKSWLIGNALLLPPEIAFPLVALTSRLTQRLDVINNMSVTKYSTGKAWDVLSKQYRDSKMGLSFLQGNFLLAQVDFADGRAQRAYASVALGIRTIQSAGLNREQHASTRKHSEAEEMRRITWAFFMLDRSYNASRNYSPCLADKHFTLQLPATDTEESYQRQGSPTNERLQLSPRRMGESADQDILTCLIRLHSIWGKATEYVFEPFGEDALPPWQSGSALAVLESEWLDFETHFPDKYRYINVDFKRCACEDPQSRAYLSTWLCCQFLLHSIQCILHHPFFTMAKLRNMKGNLSATFLQKSYESSLLHSRWIARLVKEMSEVDFQVHDPFLGYLAAIAATIQLEHTVNKRPKVALMINNEFRVLVDFMTRLSTHWASTKALVDRVNEIAARHRNYGSLYYNQGRYSGAHPRMPTTLNIPRMSDEDEALLWEILDLGSCLEPVGMEIQALSPSLDQDIGIGDSHPVDQLPISDVQVLDHGSGILSPSAKQLHMQMPECESEYSMRGWPFAGRNDGDNLGEGIPGIPDWMLLYGYLTESL